MPFHVEPTQMNGERFTELISKLPSTDAKPERFSNLKGTHKPEQGRGGYARMLRPYENLSRNVAD